VPLTSMDLGAAMLAVAYQPPGERRGFANAVSHPSSPSGRAKAGTLADSVWTRYGATDVSPAYLAYLAEVCPAYAPWPRLSSDDPVARFLDAWHAPCRLASSREVTRYAPGQRGPERICVSSLRDDPVVPAGSTASWRPRRGVILLPARRGGVHGSAGDLAACARYVGMSTE
jgi:hypothetical protein